MSFHSSLVAALPADLATAGVVTSSAQVYFGRRPQHVTRQDREVWVERLEVTEAGTGAQIIRAHAYRAHVRLRSNAGGDKTGKAQQDTAEALARTLAETYRGTRRLYASSGLTSLVAWEATEEQETDPGDEEVIDVPVRLVAWVEE